jgi:hypothetical protein
MPQAYNSEKVLLMVILYSERMGTKSDNNNNHYHKTKNKISILGHSRVSALGRVSLPPLAADLRTTPRNFMRLNQKENLTYRTPQSVQARLLRQASKSQSKET